jgi:hypothetical protein
MTAIDGLKLALDLLCCEEWFYNWDGKDYVVTTTGREWRSLPVEVKEEAKMRMFHYLRKRRGVKVS